MKKLVYTAALATTALAAGCVVEVDRPESCDPFAPCIVARIDLDSAGPGNVMYQAGDGLRVNARLTGTASGFIDIYPPETRSLQTPPLTAGFGLYDVWIDYINDEDLVERGTVVVDSTEMVTVDVDGDLYVDATLLLGNGFMMANWTFNGGNNTCADYADTGFSILVTPTSGGTAFDDVFICEEGADATPAITDPTPLGNYVVSASLIDGGGAIGTPETLNNRAIVDGNGYHDLGIIDISVP